MTGRGAQNIDVLNIHGTPHAEQSDPGIYPSFFLDHGRTAGQAAFLDIFRKYIQGGDTADGMYLDCFDQIPLSCKGGTCKAIRNKNGNNASIVSWTSVTNYIAGKKEGYCELQYKWPLFSWKSHFSGVFSTLFLHFQ